MFFKHGSKDYNLADRVDTARSTLKASEVFDDRAAHAVQPANLYDLVDRQLELREASRSVNLPAEQLHQQQQQQVHQSHNHLAHLGSAADDRTVDRHLGEYLRDELMAPERYASASFGNRI